MNSERDPRCGSLHTSLMAMGAVLQAIWGTISQVWMVAPCCWARLKSLDETMIK
ncbi:MAG TPA: hypothetical protein VNL13_05300 [Sulfolobales archaeon]|nr:hypothetical protein [Sulfolobales archaeon]